MKNWEIKLKKSRDSKDTYIVTTKTGRFLCNKVNNDYVVKNDSKDIISDFVSVEIL